MWSWLVAVALAAPGALELGTDVRFAEELAVSQDTVCWTVDDGFVFPVRRDGVMVGFAAVGRGAMDFAFEAQWEAERFANVLVTEGEADAATVRSAVTSGHWTEPVDVVVALSVDPAIWGPAERSVRVVRDRDAVGYTDDSGIFNVVVSNLDIDAARRLAKRSLTKRLTELAHAEIDVEAMLTIDAIDPGPDRLVVEARTERSWRPFIAPSADNLQGRWLSTVHDPYGWVNDALQTQVYVLGRGQEETVRWRTLAGTAREQALGATVTAAKANVLMSLEAGGQAVSVDVTQLLTVRADGPTQLIAWAQPYTRELDFHSNEPIASRYAGLRVETTDGALLERVADGFGVRRRVSGEILRGQSSDPRAWEHLDAGVWLLPEPLSDGETVSLVLVHEDRWRVNHLVDLNKWRGNLAADPDWLTLGRVAAARPVLGEAVGGLAHPVELRVGTTLPPAWNVAMGGGQTERIEAGDARWWAASGDSQMRVTLARDKGLQTFASMGLPAIEMLGHGPEESEVRPYLRSVFHFFGTVLPHVELPELDLVRAANAPVTGGLDLSNAWSGEVGAGNVAFGPTPIGFRESLPKVTAHAQQVFVYGVHEDGDSGAQSREYWSNTHAPRSTERAVAGAVAAQWLLDKPLATRDQWLVDALPAYLEHRFTEEAWGPKVVDKWAVLEREEWNVLARGDGPLPLERGEVWTALVGGRWFSSLQERFGERTVMRTVEQFLLADTRDTQTLAAELSRATGKDAAYWVDFWVRGGVRPQVRAEWWVDDDNQLRIEAEASTPFGRFEVPVAIESNKTTRVAWLDNENGQGSLTLPLRRGVDRVRIDPEGTLPLRSATTVRRDAISRGEGRSDDGVHELL